MEIPGQISAEIDSETSGDKHGWPEFGKKDAADPNATFRHNSLGQYRLDLLFRLA
jgi:hypothetical protein